MALSHSRIAQHVNKRGSGWKRMAKKERKRCERDMRIGRLRGLGMSIHVAGAISHAFQGSILVPSS